MQRLAQHGLNASEIARWTGVPRATVRMWLSGGLPKAYLRSDAHAGCGRCGRRHDPRDLPRRSYAYLLGMYLGDGYIASHRRLVFRLRISLDARYPGIVEECAATMADVVPENDVLSRRTDVNCMEVGAYSKSWPCLFPQHGPGPKHERRISLVDWQREIVKAEPRALLRGLIHSDGCRFTNRVTVRGKSYEYPRYAFSNASDDIRRIFCDACELVGVEWRRMNARNISVARRESVALLDGFVGPKR